MTAVGEAFVRIRPDTDGFRRELRGGVTRDVRGVERSLAGSNRELSRFSRGALVGTGALGQLGRAAAFASLSFIGGAGLVVGIKSTIDAAAEAQVVETQLANALERQGISFAQNKVAIDARVQALSQMAGIDDELITRTFTLFVRRTDDVTKALRFSAIAADVARGRNISLESAASLVTRASLGMAGALRRVGIAAENGATATELLELLQRKYAGSAEAYGRTAAGAQARFAVALENTQEIIGTALLPSITRLLDRATEWLNKTENQERIQRAVNDAADKGARFVEGLANAYNKTASALRAIESADPFGGRSIRDLARLGAASTEIFDAQIKKWEELVKAARGYGAAVETVANSIEGLRTQRAADEVAERPSLVPSASGRFFVGFPVTAAQRRARAVAQTGGAGTDAELAALRAEQAADERALAFAERMMTTQGRNRREFAHQAIRLETEIRSADERIAQITEGRIEARKDAAERQHQLGIQAANAVIANLNVRRDEHVERVEAQLRERENRLERLTRIPETLSLQTQIAEARASKEEQIVPFLKREAQALGSQIKELRRRGASQVQILQARLEQARVQRQIRDIDRQEAGGFSLQDLFSEAAGSFAALASNIAPIGVSLSPQEAGGSVIKAARGIAVTQNFYGEMPNPAQAIQQASQAARALR